MNDLYPRHDSLRPPATRRGIRIRPAAVLSWLQEWRERRRRKRVQSAVDRLKAAKARIDAREERRRNRPKRCPVCDADLSYFYHAGPDGEPQQHCGDARCQMELEIRALELTIETTKGDTT